MKNDVNIEIVHEVNVRLWKHRLAQLTPRKLVLVGTRYLFIPALLASVFA